MFKVFLVMVVDGNFVWVIVVLGGVDKYFCKDIIKKEDYIKCYGVKGLVWVKVIEEGYNGLVVKFLNDDVNVFNECLSVKVGDLVFFVVGFFYVVCDFLGYLCESIVKELDLIDENKFNYFWVINWLMFEYDEGFGKWIVVYYLFMMLNEDDFKYLEEGEDLY